MTGRRVTDQLGLGLGLGLGDYTEQLLTAIGITKERYNEVKEMFGFAPTCDCDDRKKWLNKVGAYFGIGANKLQKGTKNGQ